MDFLKKAFLTANVYHTIDRIAAAAIMQDSWKHENGPNTYLVIPTIVTFCLTCFQGLNAMCGRVWHEPVPHSDEELEPQLERIQRWSGIVILLMANNFCFDVVLPP
jgi:hypothetical protein